MGIRKDTVTVLWKTITKIGIINNKEYSLKEKKLIYLFNLSCIFWYAGASIETINFLTSNPINIKGAYIYLGLTICIVITQIIHTKQYFDTGRILFIFFLIIIVLLTSNYIIPGKLGELYLLFIPGFSLVFFDNKYVHRFFFILAISCFSLPNIYFKNYPDLDFYSPGMICLFVFVSLMISYFKKSNTKNEKLLALEKDKVLSDKMILEKQEIKLRELNQFKTHFFVNLSHEIRTPITLIKGYTSKIDFKDTKENNKNKLLIVNKQVTQIENILNNILDLSKLDENKLKLNKSETLIAPFINKHYAEFKDLFNKKKITFNLISDMEDLTTAKIDSSLISKAISNLLNNALKFTQKNGKVSIKIFQNKCLTIQVIDNGIGIPQLDLEKIFERFYQSKNEITKSEGSGIGLSFTKSILEAHNFNITAESIPNESTIFTITIPEQYTGKSNLLDKIDISIPQKNTQTPTNTKVSSPTKTETILVVDDHFELIHYLKNILKEYNILEAENGVKALEVIKNNTIDLVLTDYMMPEMDGKELVTQIKKLHIKVPIIILTARADDFAKLDMLRIGVDNYMIKPFIEEELLLSISHSLKTYKNIVKNLKELTTEEQKKIEKVASSFNKKIREIIESNISNSNFGIDEIASVLNISNRTLNRRTKNILGQTCKELIIKTKIEKARFLQLEKPEMSKKEIAYAVGFSNSTYLFKLLTETYGNHHNN